MVRVDRLQASVKTGPHVIQVGSRAGRSKHSERLEMKDHRCSRSGPQDKGNPDSAEKTYLRSSIHLYWLLIRKWSAAANELVTRWRRTAMRWLPNRSF